MSGAAAGTMAVSGAGIVTTVSAASWQENADQIFEYLTQELGYTEAAACGIMANIRCESTFNPHAWNAGGGSYGLCQWTGGRYSRLQNWCRSNGYDYTTIEGQLAYLEYELNAHYPGVEEYLRNVDNTADGAYDAGQYYCYHFEAPASRASVSVYRGGLASGTFWDTYRPAEWYKVDGIWHYILRDGSYQTEWLTIEGETFYLDEEGRRISGWRTIDGDRYYFDENGVMVTGWYKVDGSNYYFREDGTLVTGLARSGEDWYLLDRRGSVQASSAMEEFAPVWIASAEQEAGEAAEEALAAADQSTGSSAADAAQDLTASTDQDTKDTLAAAEQNTSSNGTETALELTSSADRNTGEAAEDTLTAKTDASENGPVNGPVLPNGNVAAGQKRQTGSDGNLTAMEALRLAALQAVGKTDSTQEGASARAAAVPAASALTEEASARTLTEAFASAASATTAAAEEIYASNAPEDAGEEGEESAAAAQALMAAAQALQDDHSRITDASGAGEAEDESAGTGAAADPDTAADTADTEQTASEDASGDLSRGSQEDEESSSTSTTAGTSSTGSADSEGDAEAADSDGTAEAADSHESVEATDSDVLEGDLAGTQTEEGSAEEDSDEADPQDAETDESDETSDETAAEAPETEKTDAAGKAADAEKGSSEKEEEKKGSVTIHLLWEENESESVSSHSESRKADTDTSEHKEDPAVTLDPGDGSPVVSLDRIDDLVQVLEEAGLLTAESANGRDITSEVTASFSKEVEKPGDYTATFRLTHSGTTVVESALIHVD